METNSAPSKQSFNHKMTIPRQTIKELITHIQMDDTFCHIETPEFLHPSENRKLYLHQNIVLISFDSTYSEKS